MKLVVVEVDGGGDGGVDFALLVGCRSGSGNGGTTLLGRLFLLLIHASHQLAGTADKQGDADESQEHHGDGDGGETDTNGVGLLDFLTLLGHAVVVRHDFAVLEGFEATVQRNDVDVVTIGVAPHHNHRTVLDVHGVHGAAEVAACDGFHVLVEQGHIGRVVDGRGQDDEVLAEDADAHGTQDVLQVVAFVGVIGLVAGNGVEAGLGATDKVDGALDAVDSQESTHLGCEADLHALELHGRHHAVHHAALVGTRFVGGRGGSCHGIGLRTSLRGLCHGRQHREAEQTCNNEFINGFHCSFLL